MDLSNMYEQFRLQDMEEKIERLFPEWDIHFQDLFQAIITGHTMQYLKQFFIKLLDQFAGEIFEIREIFITLLLLGILSALFLSLTGIFEHQHLADYGFYYIYLIMILFLIKIYAILFANAREMIENITLFMKVFLPTYFLTVAATGGSASAMGYYQLFMAAVYGIEVLIVRLFLPGIGIYMLLNMINGVWKKD